MPSRKSTRDVGKDYLQWLRERLKTVRREDTVVLTTPFLDAFHDGIQIYVEPNGGGFTLHDNGDTLDNLSSMGVKIEDSERRRALIDRAAAGCAVRLSEGRLEATATMANLAQRVHFLVTSILRLNDLWMSQVPHSFTDFFGLVSEFLDSHGVRYVPNVSIPGRTVEHPIDFVIPLPRKAERLVKLIGTPSPQTAKIVSFTWMELKEARPASNRIVVLNDVRLPDPLEEETEESFRQVSDQTVAILQGYSDTIYRWSQRDTAQFGRLWSPNGSKPDA